MAIPERRGISRASHASRCQVSHLDWNRHVVRECMTIASCSCQPIHGREFNHARRFATGELLLHSRSLVLASLPCCASEIHRVSKLLPSSSRCEPEGNVQNGCHDHPHCACKEEAGLCEGLYRDVMIQHTGLMLSPSKVSTSACACVVSEFHKPISFSHTEKSGKRTTAWQRSSPSGNAVRRSNITTYPSSRKLQCCRLVNRPKAGRGQGRRTHEELKKVVNGFSCKNATQLT